MFANQPLDPFGAYPNTGAGANTGPFPLPSNYHELLCREVLKQRLRQDAQGVLVDERTQIVALPELESLAQLLAEPDVDAEYQVEGLWPTGGRVVLVAPHKAGKSTLVANLLRSLVDGEKFLDELRGPLRAESSFLTTNLTSDCCGAGSATRASHAKRPFGGQPAGKLGHL
ncbi:hypothetical protein AESSP_01914 [Aestuariimicrobium sp. T2.26MG-19.2B]|nr:hypothetical protein AESSP_01914 [Aestuariimicrobium sp. T2.26MG-19.2B]